MADGGVDNESEPTLEIAEEEREEAEEEREEAEENMEDDEEMVQDGAKGPGSSPEDVEAALTSASIFLS